MRGRKRERGERRINQKIRKERDRGGRERRMRERDKERDGRKLL